MDQMSQSRALKTSLQALCGCVALTAGMTTWAQRATTGNVLPTEALAARYFGNDAAWFAKNIPFLDIDDPGIKRVYYYRWQLYRAHMRDIGWQGTDETEFLADVPWARKPYTDLNDSSSFHILEGRWLRNPAYIESLVDHLYAGGGNDRHFSESIAAATYAWTQVTGNAKPALRHLDAMQHVYNLWDDHFDHEHNLYWIEPLLDATEYSIASIDASGAGFADTPSRNDWENGFTGGFSFRPSINAYQFANAKAIAALAHMNGDEILAAEYERRAEALRKATLQQLWNPQLSHFTDVYQRSTRFVEAGTFIRGRELVGYVPWMYELPPRDPGANTVYNSAWVHVLKSDELAGRYGLRTAEPSYPRYMHQYRFDAASGLPECQWNGPSWPFQTSQTLTALANLLHNYKQTIVSTDDYLYLLRQYAKQHERSDGSLDIQEDYNPDTGHVIVGLPRSHHYNHSTYVDLVISGLLGIRPRSDNVLEVDPLISRTPSAEPPIRYFALQGLRYHGHDLTIVYDRTGTRYHIGAGLSAFSDGRRIAGPRLLGRMLVPLNQGSFGPPAERDEDVAVNVWERKPSRFEADLPSAFGYPATDDAHVYDAIDGRVWFYPEIPNGWSPGIGTNAAAPKEFTFTVDLPRPRVVHEAQLFFFADDSTFYAPTRIRLEVLTAGTWKSAPRQRIVPASPIGNGMNSIKMPAIEAQHFRVLLTPSPKGRLRLVEFKLLSIKR
jgi:hypothetical protein